IGSIDMLIVHGVFGSYPIAWLPTLVAGAVAVYLVRYTDLLRPQGYDRNALIKDTGSSPETQRPPGARLGRFSVVNGSEPGAECPPDVDKPSSAWA
ncbi:MAG TPA: hypothetical protein VFO62_12670, partial [Candidatus Binatia bacterium]|nr:hypothetical protein [Candidatus Binatia bacterium]